MIKLSPSDFAYLYEDCKHCYYLKVKKGITLPSMPMPGIFGAINTRVQGTLVNDNLQTLAKNLPEGRVVKQEGFVESKVFPGTDIFLKGKYDLLVKKPDGKFLLVDLKLSQPNEDKIDKYKTQLYSYKYAMENPKYGEKIKIDQLGLLIMYPDEVHFADGKTIVEFPPKWLEVPIDEKNFLSFIKEVDSFLAGPLPPPTDTCSWCQYRKKFRIEKKQEKQLEQISFF